MTESKKNAQQVLNRQLALACIELEAEINNALPEDSIATLYHVKNKHRRMGYHLARQIHPSVANGATIVLISHANNTIELFAALCSTKDTYSRLDGKKEVLSRVHQKYVKGIVDANRPSLVYPVDASKTYDASAREVINTYIRDVLNSRVKPKAPQFTPTREQVLTAEASLVTLLKEANPNGLDYRLIYKHETSKRSEKTHLKAVVAKTEHNSAYGQDVIDEFEKQAEKLTVKVRRHYKDQSNRLSARWYAIKKMIKKLKSK